jgi:hypothetical protein
MDAALCQAAMEAQMLMGHTPAAAHMALDRRTVVLWSWDVDQVRQALHVPLTDLWEQRVFELEMQGLASFSFYAAPVTYDAEGHEHAIPGWQDRPRDELGSVSIHPQGVLKLAALYGRPYVKMEESPAVLAHWQLVQAESEARLHMPIDEAQHAKEWPERALYWKAWRAQEGYPAT